MKNEKRNGIIHSIHDQDESIPYTPLKIKVHEFDWNKNG